MRRLILVVPILCTLLLLSSCTEKHITTNSPVPIPQWLELPATNPSDGLDFFSRTYILNNKELRNYSYYWDYSSRVSHWVAYPLCKDYLGSAGRSEAWGYDLFLPASKQSNVSGGFKEGNNGWYTRGHLLPSEDRSESERLNATTFYGTNIAPMNNDFDSGVWHTLGVKVRSWAASSDTLYVITGCVVEDAQYYVLDRSNNKVTVPTAFFKAILRYKNDPSSGYNGFMGAAFWYNHERFPRTFSKDGSMSIADLEEKLGYELFVNLPKVTGQSVADVIKTEKPSTNNWWW